MTDTELTLRVTEWCEPLESSPEPVPGWQTIGPTTFRVWHSPRKFWRWDTIGKCWLPAFDFATDRNACALFEALVEERGKWLVYQQHLEDVAYESRRELTEHNTAPSWVVGAMIRAPAKQRCLALVRLVGGED